MGVIMKLLIAEDDAFFRKILKQELASEHELILANDGHEAWAALQRPVAPRLAILDWVMPGLTGPQICRNVRACDRLSSMYLILFTARNSTADVVSGLRAGADDYITKPFDADELRLRIKLGELLLDLQDAAEMHAMFAQEEFERKMTLEERAGSWPVSAKASGVDHLCRVEDCLIDPYEPAAHSSSVLGTNLAVPDLAGADLVIPPQQQYFLETLNV
jgi:CheY-like chemotaxis protein